MFKCKKCQGIISKNVNENYSGYCSMCFKALRVAERPKRKRKPTATKQLRKRCWNKFHGDNVYGICYTCEERLHILDYQVGHIISHHAGGTLTISNVRPQCSSCNSQQQTMHMDDFKKSLCDLSYETVLSSDDNKVPDNKVLDNKAIDMDIDPDLEGDDSLILL